MQSHQLTLLSLVLARSPLVDDGRRTGGSDDRIMLTGLGFTSFTDVEARTTDGDAGAVITLDALKTVTLFGVTAASLSPDDFLLAL